ncbi:MAG: adenylyltransferase/cytidyltransferase family protein [bacterium]
MKTVIAFGTFDILHPGHMNFLSQAAKHGDLIAVIARDKTVQQIKGKLPRHNEKERLRAVKGLKLASKAILGSLTDKYAAIKKYQPDTIALGYDQTYFTEQLGQKLKKIKLKTKIIKLKPFKPNKYKTSILKNSITIC